MLFAVLQDCGDVVVFLWFRGGVFVVVSTSGPRTRAFRCFARLW